MGTLYALQRYSGGPIKLGWSSKGTAEARRKAAQTYSDEPLTILVEAPGSMAQEQTLHRVFDAYRREGEWFQAEGVVAEFIEYLLNGGSVASYLGAP